MEPVAGAVLRTAEVVPWQGLWCPQWGYTAHGWGCGAMAEAVVPTVGCTAHGWGCGITMGLYCPQGAKAPMAGDVVPMTRLCLLPMAGAVVPTVRPLLPTMGLWCPRWGCDIHARGHGAHRPPTTAGVVVGSSLGSEAA